MYRPLLENLTPNDHILTVNQRLAQFLRQQYGALFASKNQPVVFDAEQIFSWQNFIEQQWRAVQASQMDGPVLLSAPQEHLVWRQVIEQSEYADQLLSAEPVVATAQQAWQFMQHWQLSVAAIQSAGQVDVQAFKAWVKAFEQQCHQHNWLSMTAVPGVLLQSDVDREMETIYLVGFTELPPVFEALLTKICRQYHLVALPEQATSCHAVACYDSEQERYQAGLWAKQQWQKNPQQRLAIVVPELHQCRQSWLDSLSEVLSDCDLVTNVSGGQPLMDFSIVQAALNILKLLIPGDIRPLMHALLGSPFCRAGHSEMNARALLARYLLKHCHQPIGLKDLLALPKFSELCPVLHQSLSVLAAFDLSKRHAITNHCAGFMKAWHCLDWPGERTLNSEEFQLVEQCYQLLQDLPGLQLVLPNEVTFQQAIHCWQQALQNHIFQAQTVAQPQLEVLGLLEIAGLSFDAIWVCDMQAHTLPQPVNANPFLPVSLQRQHNMPQATAERQWHYATQFKAQIQQQCRDAYFSYPQWQADQPILPSQLISDLPVLSLDALYQDFRTQQLPQTVALEALSEAHAPPIDQQTLATAHYHTGVFRAQALCPFQAMARYRWQVEAVEPLSDYLDLRLRGEILHDILQAIWQQLGNQAALLALQQDGQQLSGFLHDHIDRTLTRWAVRYPYQLTKAVCQIEQQRLHALLLDWLVLESERADFQVLAEEQLLIGQIGPLSLQLRIDRLDQLTTGQQLVLDYKTGSVTPKSWFGTRPTDAQLPIYAVLSNSDGVVYARLNAKGIAWTGIAQSDQWFTGVFDVEQAWQQWAEQQQAEVNSWPELLTYWRQQLTDLAEQFAAGYAAVAPKSIALACQYCDLKMLCRVEEQS